MRNHEIKKAAIEANFAEWHNGNSAIVETWINGAQWADAHPDPSWATRLKLEKEELIDKAVEWLEDNYLPPTWDEGSEKEQISIFVEQFKRAMQDGSK